MENLQIGQLVLCGEGDTNNQIDKFIADSAEQGKEDRREDRMDRPRYVQDGM